MSEKATIVSSPSFTALSAQGTDWRVCTKQILEALEEIRTEGWQPDVGFVYVTEDLAGDMGAIVDLLRSVSGIDIWSGCAAAGICGPKKRYIDMPAIAVLIGEVGSDKIKPITVQPNDRAGKMDKDAREWALTHQPMLVMMHGDPHPDSAPNFCMNELAKMTGGFVVGGLSSSRPGPVHTGVEIMTEGFSGLLFSSDVKVATTLSQGCTPISPPLVVTRCDGALVQALDGQVPMDVFADCLKKLVQDTTGQDPDDIFIEQGAPLPAGFEEVLNGDVHIAFPVQGSDMQDFIVRNMAGIDPDTGDMMLTQEVKEGDTILFCKRNRATVRAELTRALLQLRRRIEKEEGIFSPRGGIYISCAARMDIDEMAIIREVIGDIPLTGFFGAGEIHGGRLYTYTGILVLFV